MINVLIAGFRGKMGRACMDMVLGQSGFNLVALYDPSVKKTEWKVDSTQGEKKIPVYQDKESMVQGTKIDVWIDFTNPKVVYEHVHFAISHDINVVVGTTGLTEEQIKELTELAEAREIGGLIAPNFAIGAVLMMQFAKQAARYYSDVEIIESHHPQKLDAPSGTALKTAEMICEVRSPKQQGHPDEKELLVGARGADYEGIRIHSVRLPGLIAHQEVQFGQTGELLTIRHDSYDRESFMSGVSLGINKVTQLKTLVYGLEEIL